MNIKKMIKYLILATLCLGWIPPFYMAWDSSTSAINDELTRYVNEKVITPQQGSESMWAIGAYLIIMSWFMVWPIIISIVSVCLSGLRIGAIKFRNGSEISCNSRTWIHKTCKIIICLILTSLFLGWIPYFFMTWNAAVLANTNELTRYVNEEVIASQQAEETIRAIESGLMIMKWIVTWPIIVSIVALYFSFCRWIKGAK